jgi:hypothetical protein
MDDASSSSVMVHCLVCFEQANEDWLTQVVFPIRRASLVSKFEVFFLWQNSVSARGFLTPIQPPETGIGEVGNKKVTSKCGKQYQLLVGEACISCARQQESATSWVTWLHRLRAGTNHRMASSNLSVPAWHLICTCRKWQVDSCRCGSFIVGHPCGCVA